MNIVMAMNMGGDDFIAKPFDLQSADRKITCCTSKKLWKQTHKPLIECGEVVLNLNDTSVAVRGERSTSQKMNF